MFVSSAVQDVRRECCTEWLQNQRGTQSEMGQLRCFSEASDSIKNHSISPSASRLPLHRASDGNQQNFLGRTWTLINEGLQGGSQMKGALSTEEEELNGLYANLGVLFHWCL